MKKLFLISLFIPALHLTAQTRLLNKDSLERDLQLLYQVLDEVHPGTYRYMDREQLKAEFEQFQKNLPASISEGDFMIRLAKTVAKVKCGHTYLNPWNMDQALRARLFDREIYFPIGIEIVAGRFYITENVSEHPTIKRGAEILSMNGVPISTVYDSLKSVAKMDGNNINSIDPYLSVREYGMRDWEAFELYFSLFFPTKDHIVALTFKNFGDTKPETVKLKLLTKEDRSQKMKASYGDLSKARKEWKLTMLDDQRAILKIGTFAIWNWKGFNYKKWLNDAFSQIEKAGVKTLMVDIRGNGGGDDNARDELLSYLVKEKIERKSDTRSLIRMTQIPQELQPYCNTWLEVIMKGLPKNQYEYYNKEYFLFNKGIGGMTISPKKKAFKGHVFLLGDGSNTSATYTTLLLAQTYGFAQHIGSESGGNLQGINGSQYVFFYLPYSKMEIDIPLIFSQPTQTMPDQGVKADIRVMPTQKSIALKMDPLLDAAQ